MNSSDLAGSLIVPAIRLPDDYGKMEEFTRLLGEAGVAGFIVYGGDPELTPPFLRRLREAAGRPILVMADYERGAGAQVPGMPELPPAMAIGATRSPEAAYMAGKITALSARSLSVSVVLAPVLDVLSHPLNPIGGTRAFSDDPDLVTKLGLAFVEGVQEEGVIACAKHFPGHGDTEKDSHMTLPRVSASREVLDERELVPFRAAARAGVGMVMTAHAVYEHLDPDEPATFSRPIITDLLRERWEYPGIVVTDALTMEGAKADEGDPAVRALAAGVDLLLYPDDPWATRDTVAKALEEGVLSESALLMSHARVSLLAADQLHDAPVRRDLTREYGFEIDELARRSLTLGADPDGLLEAVRRADCEIVGVVVDDDGLPRRARAFDHRKDRLSGGVIHVTREGTGVTGGVAESLRGADLVLLGILSDTRAYKGRNGLSPELVGFVMEVLREYGEKTLAVVLGNPALVAELPVRNVVFGYGDVDATRRAALDTIFDGGELSGTLPVPAGPGFPRGTGAGPEEGSR